MTKFKPMLERLSRMQMIGVALFLAAVVVGILLRVIHLQGSGFFFYDEGLYLNHNRAILEIAQTHPSLSSADLGKLLSFYFKLALGSGKALWFFIIDSRVFWGGVKDWEFCKVMACVFGLATFPVVFVFARRFYSSNTVAFLSVALLALLPGHVFYSRIGLQEALSIFLVLSGFYLYLFPRVFGWRTIAAGVLLAAAFFANYRLCILPVVIAVAELWIGLVERKGINWRKYSWFGVTFLALMVIVGSLFDGANTRVVFAWVFHQGDTAKEVFSWINFLSYPYYLFRLEGWILAIFFFANGYFLIQKRWEVLLPFILACTVMLIFSAVNEKGVRYFAVMLPFFVMSSAYVLKLLFDHLAGTQRAVLASVVAVMVLLMVTKSVQLVQANSDSQNVAEFLLNKDSAVKIVSAQELVMSLYLPAAQVKPLPQSFDRLLLYYGQGYRYLVLGPQAYVELGSEGRFTLPLKDYLVFFDDLAKPIQTWPHLNYAMMERFVFEHSTNLLDSVRFLGSDKVSKYSSLRVYDLRQIMPSMIKIAEGAKKKK